MKFSTKFQTKLYEENLGWVLKDYYYKLNWNTPNPSSVKEYLIRNVGLTNVFYKQFKLPTFRGTNDEKILKILNWVINYLTYKRDVDKFKCVEVWEDMWQENNLGVLQTKTCDCESGATLIFAIARYNKIYSPIILNCGYVKTSTGKGGHCWIEYLSDETMKYHTIDWCYYADLTKFSKRKTKEEDENYISTWFSVSDMVID